MTGGVLVGQHLARLGHRRVAFLGSVRDIGPVLDRRGQMLLGQMAGRFITPLILR